MIGQPIQRQDLARLVAGRGRYVADIHLTRMAHAAFVRSPHASGRIRSIDTSAATRAEGVLAVLTGAELSIAFTSDWRSDASVRVVPQQTLPADRVSWQGQPLVLVVAETLDAAHDAAELVILDIEPHEAVADPVRALERGPHVHDLLGTNLAAAREIRVGAPPADPAFSITQALTFHRLTGAPLEPRGLIAAYDPAADALTVWQSHQAPHQQQAIFSRLLGIAEQRVRVICPNVGGGFGVKLHAYPDEIAILAAAKLLGRPVKYIATRTDSFASDVHAREHRVSARLELDANGRFTALAVDDIAGMGAYSAYPRTSLSEGVQVLTLTGSPYAIPAFEGRVRFAYQNKAATGAVRAVGHPLAATIMEQLVDEAAARLAIDPVELRLRNLHADGVDVKAPSGMPLGPLSLRRCLERLVAMMDYPRLREEQRMLRARGVHRGIGVAVFTEITGPGPGFYGPAGVEVSSQDGCYLKLEPSGRIVCATSTTDQGQGTLEGIAQIIAATLGVAREDVEMLSGDTLVAPYGGGAWASRGIPIGGEAALHAAERLRDNILHVGSLIAKTPHSTLRLANAAVHGGPEPIPLEKVARTVYFQAHLLPADAQPQLAVAHSYTPRNHPYLTAVGAQASLLEIDVETGAVTLLHHWVVEDCGRIINPRLVDDQLRGGVVQGIGAALFERCAYDSDGQLVAGSFLDYRLPIATDIPPIDIAHIETPAASVQLGAKGAGEAGAGGAPPAIWSAVNDALAPFGRRVGAQPITAPDVLRVIRGFAPS